MKLKLGLFCLIMVWIMMVGSISKVKGEGLMMSCKACVLMEARSGRVLYQKDANNQMMIASITKIMTAIIAIEEGYLETYVTISNNATKQVGSSLYVKEGEQLKLIDLIYGLLLRSGNDAAYAISEHVAGSISEFVYLMNEKAKTLGMHNTVFENPSGLDETNRNLSTAYDMALLMSYAIDNPIYLKINGTTKHQAESAGGRIFVFNNKHRLINHYDFITGGKTGYTEKAKRTLVTSAHKKGMDLVVVTLNDGNDWEDHMRLFDYGFNLYEQRHLFDKGILYVKELDQLLFLSEDFIYPLKEDEIDRCELVIDKKENQYYLHLMMGERILFTRSMSEYHYFHDDVTGFPDLFIKEKIKAILGDWIW